MTFKLYNHNIYLFAYYLSESNNSLGEYKPDWLWNKCDEIIAKTLKTEFHFNVKQYLDLENKPEEAWANLNKFFPKTDDYHPIYIQPHNCFFDPNSRKKDLDSKTSILYPVQLYDSYGFGLKLINPNNEYSKGVNDKEIALFNPNNCLMLDLEQDNQYFLGQTLFITINLENRQKLKYKNNRNKLKNIADNYIESLLPDYVRKPPFNRAGSLFGSPIFEYGIIRASQSYSHIIIWFILDDSSEERFDKYYQQLLDLFFFRAKIIHAYNEIIKIEKEAKKKSKDIQLEIEKTQENYNKNKIFNQYRETKNELDLNKLKNLLIELPSLSLEYTEKIRIIKEFQNVVVSYTKNYSDKIYEIRSNFSDEEDFSFLELFTDRTCYPFQDRIVAAVNFFQLDTNLINNAIDSIRGQVEIEQAHRERQLQTTITSLGIGIAVAGNFASSYEAGSITENDEGNYPDILGIPFDSVHFTISFCISMVIGFIAWQGASWFFSWWYIEEQLIRKTRFKLNPFRLLQNRQHNTK
ncbi:hypothetical protein [Mastigocoleus testarum]|uniref:Uncharacterized protein n=1 Tax=Mastigocoleus testarum BC008 TaxID=371196 RepID=A0A0V7ZXJ1_9CYAN|nr:hypothetical protein [Mastigocoleus testarum]KST62502.1 hypothetical protein BC008_10045 [Mastigocoleus testarum BC008]KST69122.1 hypothetical protein BC008_35000 [Mastigocoleus testarum BC008]